MILLTKLHFSGYWDFIGSVFWCEFWTARIWIYLIADDDSSSQDLLLRSFEEAEEDIVESPPTLLSTSQPLASTVSVTITVTIVVGWHVTTLR